MLGGLFVVSLIITIVQLIKEACEPTIPAENWSNRELINKDRMSGISDKEFYKNLADGKYILKETYPEPPKNKQGKIIIQNSLLYEEDCRNYEPLQVKKWIEQGKYNLTPEELEKERERLKKRTEYMYSLSANKKK